MPKGHKSKHGYATVDSSCGEMGYREISEEMCRRGFKMNHSTARNVFLSAMRKFARDISKFHGSDISQEKIKQVANSKRIQCCEMLFQFELRF